MGPTEVRDILGKTLSAVARKFRSSNELSERGTTYPIWHVVRVFLLCLLEGISLNVFYARLRATRGYRKELGLPNRLISLSQLKKRMARATFLRAMQVFLRESAARALEELGTEEVRIVMMDLTRLESDPRRDSRGGWGWDSRGLIYGYKLGLIISQQGVILGMTLTRGNWGEFNVNRQLLKRARDVIRTRYGILPVDYVLCDAGFDGESTYKGAHELLKASVLCPARRKRNPKVKTAHQVLSHARACTPHRLLDQSLWEIPDLRKLFRKRNQIERVNGQIKDSPIRMAEIPWGRRGVKRLRPLCLAKLILYNLALNVNIAEGRSIRCIKLLVA